MHQNAGILFDDSPDSDDDDDIDYDVEHGSSMLAAPSTSGVSTLGSLTPHFGSAGARKARFKAVESSPDEQESYRIRQALIIAIVYLISCSIGFIGGSIFFLPGVSSALTEKVADAWGCWFFIIFSLTFIYASVADILLLVRRGRANGERVLIKNMLVPALPIIGALVWIFGSVALLPSFSSLSAYGAPSFIAGSICFQISSLVALIDLLASRSGGSRTTRKAPRDEAAALAPAFDGAHNNGRQRSASAPYGARGIISSVIGLEDGGLTIFDIVWGTRGRVSSLFENEDD